MRPTAMKKSDEQNRRGEEIARVLMRHHAARGVSPEKLRLILQDLGPTFVKLGQIMSMRTDILPMDYCKELEKLRADVAPMAFTQVREAVEEALGGKLEASFSTFEETPVGSASMAQAHLATLTDGQRVVVKVQRPHIRQIMEDDIALMHKADGVMKLTGLDRTIDLTMVLDEMWESAKEELDFRREAANLLEFAEKNGNIRCIGCPKVYEALSGETLLTMEYIDGFALKDREAIVAAGYDLKDIGDKLAANYVKQIVTDGYFHADPHPGNIRIREGKIIWIDMGMMGRLSGRDRKLLRDAVRAVSAHDVESLRGIVMAMGKITGPVDAQSLTADIDDFLSRYESMELGGLDLGVFMKELLDLARKHNVAMPSGMTLLARGVVTIEGVLREISPETSILRIMGHSLADDVLADIDMKRELTHFVTDLHHSAQKMAGLPAQLSDLLRTANKGQARMTVEVKQPEGVTGRSMDRLTRGVLASALILGACLLPMSAELPRWNGLPTLAWVLLGVGAVLGASAVWPTRKKK